MNIIDYVIISIVIILILIFITVLSYVFPKFILVAIIILFIVSFIFNTYELFNYTNESTKIGSNKLLSYCDLGTYKLFNYDLIIDNSDIQLLIIYLILFILLWSNTIANLITNNLSSEIKILGFYKYYNRDIYENYNYEHSILWAIMIFVAYSFIIYLFNFIYYNFAGLNLKNIDLVSHINILNKTIKDNTSCDYLNSYISEVAKKTGGNEEIFRDYYALAKSKTNIYKDDKDLYLKCYITYHLFGLEKRETIKYDNTFCKDDNYCIFNLLKGKDVYSVFPDKFKPLKFMENAIYTGGKTFATDSNDIEKNYNQFISTLHNSYSYLKSHERYNSFYYKLDLLFAKLSGMIFSIIAIIFFIKTEFKQFIKNMTGITIDPLEYIIDVETNNIMIKGLILFITIIFIAILFNT